MDKNRLKNQLEKLLEQGKEFTFRSLPKGEYGYPKHLTPEWIGWNQRVRNIIYSSFDPDSSPSKLVAYGSNTIIIGYGSDAFEQAKNGLLKGIEQALDVLEDDFFGELINISPDLPKEIDKRKIFIVHGHDHAAKTELEIFVRDLGLDPVVLHREADEGMTLIEKFENHSKVGYAFVILTPDDKVSFNNSETDKLNDFKFRARQNVILELGFFVGQLGRKRVCCVLQKGVEIPSDINGLVYKQFHEHIEEVKLPLIKELKKAGYSVDLKI